jgi:Ca-activated chloride channel family protein
MVSAIRIAILSLLSMSAAGALAQNAALPTDDDEPVATLKLQTKIVSIPVVVRTKAGARVPGLTNEDFAVKEDGKPQEVRYFSRGFNLPITLAVLVDASGSQYAAIDAEIRASQIFFAALMKQHEDRALLVRFGSQVTTIQPMTSSLLEVEQTLKKFPDYVGMPDSGTDLYDAVNQVSKEDLEGQKGRKAMVLLTLGHDTASRATLDQAVLAAQEADVTVYSIMYMQDPDLPVNFIYQDRLETLARATGGRVFMAGGKMTLKQIYAAIEIDLRLQYLLGYRAPEAKPWSYHQVKVTSTHKDFEVQAKTGYYTAK